MTRKLNTIVSLLILVLMLGVLIMSTACWGSPLFSLKIENRTVEYLTIYVNDYRVGDVGPGETGTRKVDYNIGKYLVVAKDSKGQTIYSKEFTSKELNETEWKVIIQAITK